jgi:hypothetical protein
LSWPLIVTAQSLESARAFAFDRGLVEVTEPYAAIANPALLFERDLFRFYAEWQHTGKSAYLLALAYPLSAKMGFGLAWHAQRRQDFYVTSPAVFSTSYARQTFLFSLGFHGHTRWGQQFEATLEANRATRLTDSPLVKPPFGNDQRVRLIYRLGFYREFSSQWAIGLLTPPLINFSYRTFLEAPRPNETGLDFGKEPGTRVGTPRVALQWQPREFLRFAFSNRSTEGKTNAQLAIELRLTRNLYWTSAYAKTSEQRRAAPILGLGGHVSGFDAFAAYEAKRRDLRVAVAFAPERTKELVEVENFSTATPALYPYRLQHNQPAYLTQIELFNKTAKPVVLTLMLAGDQLPAIKRNVILKGEERATLDVPVLSALQKLANGTYRYHVEIVAFQRGRQEINRELTFEIKDAHDWSGDGRDLIFFVQAHEREILQHSRALLTRNGAKPNAAAFAKCFYHFLRDSLRYFPDPRPLQARQDRVQYAAETLRLRGGDCEDLTVLMVSLLESAGVRAAFVDAVLPASNDGHIFLLFDSQQSVVEAVNNGDNLQRYLVRNHGGEARLFIPLELTHLEKSFEEARDEALRLYQKLAIDANGLAQGWVKIIDMPEAGGK